jgi:hypothetical protein
MNIDTNLDLYPCANLCSPGDTVEMINKIEPWYLIQQLVNFGFTNTVLLCFAFEYSDIWVALILKFFFVTSGFKSALT